MWEKDPDNENDPRNEDNIKNEDLKNGNNLKKEVVSIFRIDFHFFVIFF